MTEIQDIESMADCVEKLAALLEKNRVNIVWASGHNDITQNETADKLTRKGARSKPTELGTYLSPLLRRYKSKIKN